jgi:quinohemoprotein ethanol dehydrogenase
MRFQTFRSMVLAALLLAGCSKSDGNAVDDARLAAADKDPANWLTHGGTYEEQRFSRAEQITDSNVTSLGLAWSAEFDNNRGQEATPIVADGVIYTTTAWSKVYAFEAKTGKQLWSYDPEVPGETAVKACCDVVNRGAAIYDGKIYFGTLDGRLIALDAKTGKPVWSMVTVDQSKPYTITGAPRIAKGRVLIGNGGAELGVRGYISAYDAETGKLAWRFYTVPAGPGAPADGAASDPVMSKARTTWFGDWSKGGGGGTVWDAIVYDEEFNQILIGVGNGSPWNHRIRSQGKGDNLFLSSVVALDANTGAYKWHYQGTPGETWDFTQTQPIILADLTIAGSPRKVLMQAPKNGYFYVIDRQTGKLISAKGFVSQNWTTGIDMKTGRPIENPAARYQQGNFVALPSALGAHNWHPMAFSPKTGLVYLPAQEVPYNYQADASFTRREAGWNLGIDWLANTVPDDPAARRAIRAMLKGRLVAWDPVRQKEVWRVEYDGPWNGGVLATAGNLVFQGNAKGEFAAFSADRGAKLWSFDAGTGIVAAPVSFMVDGEQYIAVMAGYGGAYPLSSAYIDKPRPMPNGRLLVFKLGARTPYSVPKMETTPAILVNDTFSASTVTHGERIFESTCGVCHGSAAVSGGVLPDLRRSGLLADKDSWNGIVIGGALKDRGMVGFAGRLSDDDAEAVRAFVAGKARLLHASEAKRATGQK